MRLNLGGFAGNLLNHPTSNSAAENIMNNVRWARTLWFLTVCLVAPFSFRQTSQPSAQAIVWHPWSNEIFAQATREHKFVLLDLEAVWCHWCHAMDQETYSDRAVQRLMSKSYIAVKVDQDSRPDLSNRYEDYGWPATVILKADGSEIVKRQGYLPPKLSAPQTDGFDSTGGD